MSLFPSPGDAYASFAAIAPKELEATLYNLANGEFTEDKALQTVLQMAGPNPVT